MRGGRILVLFACLMMFLGIIVIQPAGAEKCVQPDMAARSHRDNSGRKLAIAGPRPEKEDSDKDETAKEAVGRVRDNLVQELKSHNISVDLPSIDLPDDMEKTCDVCYKAVRTTIVFAQEHTASFSAWMARYFKQLSGPAQMTPCGSPYLMPNRLVPATFGQKNSKLYITEEGRLKTVISR